MEQSMRHAQERTRNVPFTPEHWVLIEQELLRLSRETQGERRELLPSQRYFRSHESSTDISELLRSA